MEATTASTMALASMARTVTVSALTLERTAATSNVSGAWCASWTGELQTVACSCHSRTLLLQVYHLVRMVPAIMVCVPAIMGTLEAAVTQVSSMDGKCTDIVQLYNTFCCDYLCTYCHQNLAHLCVSCTGSMPKSS